jgi:hypothetical protein
MGVGGGERMRRCHQVPVSENNVMCSFQMGVGVGQQILPSGTSLQDLG